MRTKKLIYLFSFIIMAVMFTNCGSDGINCDNGLNWANEVNSELTKVLDAANAYGLDPSSGNCDALKDAYSEYIDAVEPWGECLSGAERTSWQADLDDAKQELDSIC